MRNHCLQGAHFSQEHTRIRSRPARSAKFAKLPPSGISLSTGSGGLGRMPSSTLLRNCQCTPPPPCQPCEAAPRSVVGARRARGAIRRCTKRWESSFQRPWILGCLAPQGAPSIWHGWRGHGEVAQEALSSTVPAATHSSAWNHFVLWAAMGCSWPVRDSGETSVGSRKGRFTPVDSSTAAPPFAAR